MHSRFSISDLHPEKLMIVNDGLDVRVEKPYMAVVRDGSRSVLYRYSTDTGPRFPSITSIPIQMHNLPDRVSSPEMPGSIQT